MTKKFLKTDWTETLVLLIVDIFILYVFTFWAISKVFSAINVTRDFVAFIFNIQNLAFLFGIALFANFIISTVWHFAVKK